MYDGKACNAIPTSDYPLCNSSLAEGPTICICGLVSCSYMDGHLCPLRKTFFKSFASPKVFENNPRLNSNSFHTDLPQQCLVFEFNHCQTSLATLGFQLCRGLADTRTFLRPCKCFGELTTEICCNSHTVLSSTYNKSC